MLNQVWTTFYRHHPLDEYTILVILDETYVSLVYHAYLRVPDILSRTWRLKWNSQFQ